MVRLSTSSHYCSGFSPAEGLNPDFEPEDLPEDSQCNWNDDYDHDYGDDSSKTRGSDAL